MKIFLIGMPGSGKSVAARKISKLKKISFFDTDKLIEERFQMSVSDIFKEFGEKKFREFERTVLKELIFTEESFIVATGGGLPCFNENMNKMDKAGITVYLKASIETLVQRLRLSDNRPLLYGKNDEELFMYLQETLKHRETFYASAKYMIDADKDIKEIIKDIKEIIMSESFNS